MAATDDQVAMLVGLPHREIVEARQGGHDDGIRAAVGADSLRSPSEGDPARPDRTGTAFAGEHGRTCW